MASTQTIDCEMTPDIQSSVPTLVLAQNKNGSSETTQQLPSPNLNSCEIVKVSDEDLSQIYNRLATIYERRGQIDEATSLWKCGYSISDADEHSLSLVAMLKSPSSTSQTLLEAHRNWASKYAIPNSHLLETNFEHYDGSRPIHIAYACSFWDTATIKFQLLSFARHHDRDRVKVFAYSATDIGTVISRDEMDSAVDVFRIVGDLSDREFIEQARADKIDILVELNGHSPGHRFSAMASRCAPVQISYLNYTSTCGVENVDYILADAISASPDLDPYFTETIYRLPECFFCFSYEGEQLPEVEASPHEKNGYITFGCFGSGGKINEQLIGWWAQILRSVPKSKIYIRNYQLGIPENRKFMDDQFLKFGVEKDRLLICPGTDRTDVLESYRDVDISLDTYPYCGGNTIAESLWQGVPVLTLKGDRFSSAYGASLLTHSGCSDLVATNPEDYIKKAVELSADSEKLIFYRNNLRKMVYYYGFSDSVAFAAKIESAFDDMLSRYWREK